MNKIGARLLWSTVNGSQYSPCLALGRSLSYKSDLSLDVLYPQNSANFYTPPARPKSDGSQPFTGYIPIDQLKITYSRSSGPGGQNVNCVDTKVDMRFNVNEADFISDAVKERLRAEYRGQITKEGFFVIRNDVTRYQQMNLAAALEKLRNIIRALEKTAPTVSAETLEKHRRNHERAARERISVKRHRSAIKAGRQNNLSEF